MTAAAITGIDHALVGVRDLAAAGAAWARLGFAVTPRGRHDAWGTANLCIMFPGDYVELLGIVDPAKEVAGLDRFLAEREGLLALSLGTEDAEAAFELLTAAGLAGDGPKALSRLLELPEGETRPAFRVVHPEPRDGLGMRSFFCQHLTPDLIRRPDWLAHANGARRIAALTGAVDDPAALAPRWRAVVGAERTVLADGGLTVTLCTAACHLGAAAPGDPRGLLGMAVEVAELAAAARLLAANGVAHERAGDRIDIDPAAATGVALSFVAG